MIFTWQASQWQQIWRRKQTKGLPHAILLNGQAGIGKATFANHLTRALLCQSVTESGEHCGDKPKNKCHACRLISANTHPNVLHVEPETAGGAIKIDQIREIIEFAEQSSLQGEHRVIIINPANAMNVNAANALLKTLEEPASGVLLLLISEERMRMPATILSRCQQLLFTVPTQEEALAWLKNELQDESHDPVLLLKLAQGAPLAAYALRKDKNLMVRRELLQGLYVLQNDHQPNNQDPLRLAVAMQDHPPLLVIDWMLSFVNDILHLQLQTNAAITNLDYQQELQALQQKTQLKNNIQLLNYMIMIRKHLNQGIHFNKQLIMESIFIHWMTGEKIPLCF